MKIAFQPLRIKCHTFKPRREDDATLPTKAVKFLKNLVNTMATDDLALYETRPPVATVLIPKNELLFALLEDFTFGN